jgi:hypothetical protein
MNINIHYVWGGIIIWGVLSLCAIAFIRGATLRHPHTNRQRTLSVPKSEG